jgi:hypothetical protein
MLQRADQRVPKGVPMRKGDVFCCVRQWLADPAEAGQNPLLVYPEHFLNETKDWERDLSSEGYVVVICIASIAVVICIAALMHDSVFIPRSCMIPSSLFVHYSFIIRVCCIVHNHCSAGAMRVVPSQGAAPTCEALTMRNTRTSRS